MNISKRLIFLAAGFAALAAAQDTPVHLTATFKDPAAPGKLEVNVVMGNVTVRGTARADIVIDYTVRGGSARQRATEPPPPGMHRIGGVSPLDVSEDGNTVRVNGGGFFSGLADVTIEVPIQTSVKVGASLLSGGIVVENVSGEVEVNNTNGQVTITNVSGSVVAYSMIGKVVLSLNRVTPGKTVNLSSNGDIDVTLPADAKVNVKASVNNGDIYTDFDVKLESPQGIPAPPPIPAPGDSRTRVRARTKPGRNGDGSVSGTINGGGTEMQFSTLSGRILIHKK
jgi:Putative adhesin